MEPREDPVGISGDELDLSPQALVPPSLGAVDAEQGGVLGLTVVAVKITAGQLQEFLTDVVQWPGQELAVQRMVDGSS